MNFSRFSFKQEGIYITLMSYGLPAIGLVAFLIVWILGCLPE
jgi:hypothetical protein